LHLRDIFLLQAQSVVDTHNVLAHGERRHAIGVVRYTAELLRTLPSRKRLPPGLRATLTGVYYWKARSGLEPVKQMEERTRSPVHHISGTLCISRGACELAIKQRTFKYTDRQDQRTRALAFHRDPQGAP
jgi:hypothetical protein